MLRTALIFGHSSGLGLALTEKLLEDEYIIVGISRNRCPINSNKITNITADLSVKENLINTVNEIKRKYSQFDVLAFCSGVLTAHDIDEIDYTETEYLYRVNTLAPMFIESQLLNLIKKNGTDVINITSSVLVDYYPKYTEYSSTKAAFSQFTKDLQKELKNTNSRVIEVCPSGFTSNIYKTMTGDKIDRDETKQIKANDLAALIKYIIELPKRMEVSYIYVDRK